MRDVGDLTADLKARALELGFADVGVARPDPTEHRAFYEWWLDRGHHGSMAYLARPDSRARRFDVKGTMAEVRSVVVVTHAYPMGTADAVDPSRAEIARYARGVDYHDVIVDRLRALLEWLRAHVEQPVNGRPYTDTGPILERDLAQRAGLGWFGKNTMAIHPSRGSYWFIGTLLLDLELDPDEPFAADHCGTCRACLDGCPTGALLGRNDQGAPVMDARTCISYLTIENRGDIPEGLREAIGNRVFGCDICQEVCPWNERFAETAPADPAYAAGVPGVARSGQSLLGLAEDLLEMSDASFKKRYRGSPIYRATRDGLLRNVCVALGNWGAGEAGHVLRIAQQDRSPVVRSHADWALARVGRSSAPT